MVHIKSFDVNKIILLISILRKSDINQIDFLKRDEFKPLLDVVREFTNHPEGYKKIIENPELMDLIENEIFNNPQFMNAYMEAEKHKEGLEQSWSLHQPIVEDYLKNVLGISQELDVVANIVNPRWSTGTNDMHNEIFFGAVDPKFPEDKSYGTTYLMHEAFHCLFPYNPSWNREQKGICHSLIELAIDNELRKRLGDIDFEYGSLGHADGEKIRNKLLPLWNKFISKSQSIEEVDDDFLQNISSFQELMDYCIENYRSFITIFDIEK